MISQFGSDFPKLLFVGLVERTCQKTVIREIPGIKDCFRVKEDGKDVVKVSGHRMPFDIFTDG
jgi:hypothetical protein